jgi:hypothetical protein
VRCSALRRGKEEENTHLVDLALTAAGEEERAEARRGGAGCRRRAVGRSCVLFSRAGGVEARRGGAEARCGGVSRGVASCVARLKST